MTAIISHPTEAKIIRIKKIATRKTVRALRSAAQHRRFEPFDGRLRTAGIGAIEPSGRD
jgi:hypothetical protein